MNTLDHLDSLRARLSSERQRLANAGSARERALRAVWVAQLEREIASELDFLGMPADISDDDLLAALEQAP